MKHPLYTDPLLAKIRDYLRKQHPNYQHSQANASYIKISAQDSYVSMNIHDGVLYTNCVSGLGPNREWHIDSSVVVKEFALADPDMFEKLNNYIIKSLKY